MSKGNEELEIKRDRMRFIKNKESANLALIAIVFNVFYFVSIYKSDVGSYYYNILIGSSIVLNLLFMLGTFLAEEAVKNYQSKYSYFLLALGALQIVRIFVIPMQAHDATVVIGGNEVDVMGDGQFYRLVAYLIISAVCLIASALINLKKCRELEAHLKTLEGMNA